ncbi:hypothetical protein GEV39_23125 [Pseudomonas sp. NY5710]|nr:hypothetical protein GEV39_23125 [Pseudomonas sp. NY5710]
MSACQLGKGRNCREGVAHKQGNWRIFEQPETYSHGVKAPFAGNPAPTGNLQCQRQQRTCGSGHARERAGTG